MINPRDPLETPRQSDQPVELFGMQVKFSFDFHWPAFAVLLGFAIAGMLLLGGCSKGTPEFAPRISAADVAAVVAHLDQDYPGRGITDYPGNTVEDIPKAYAMVLMAEIEIRRKTNAVSLSKPGVTSGIWLLNHSDENHDGVIGWGVPVAWDAYGDGSVNPAHSEYSISTAIVIDALLDWMESSLDAPRAKILETLKAATLPYLDNSVRTPSGLIPYSLRMTDRRYDTFNPAAYMAGQLQRFSLLVDDKSLALRMQDAADGTMLALLKHRQLSAESGAWYWNYSIQELVSNDLPHAGYIVDGIRSYIAHGGKLSNQFDRQKIAGHLLEFAGEKSGVIRAWPRFRKNIISAARSYDLGMAMYLACTEPKLEPLRGQLIAAIPAYRTADGAFGKYPLTSSQPRLVVTEYETYMLRGMATCMESTGG